MKLSVYCFVSSGEVRFVPINSNEDTLHPIEDPENDQISQMNRIANAVPREIKMKIENKNLLYKLNNASFQIWIQIHIMKALIRHRYKWIHHLVLRPVHLQEISVMTRVP